MSLEDMPPRSPLRREEGRLYAGRVLDRSAKILASHNSILDQPYGSDYYQKIDIFLPDVPAEGLLPILIFAHGGSWTGGYKEWMAFMAPAITALPAVFVSVSYRLAPEVRHPAPFDDCLAAVAWVHAHAREFNGDPGRCFLGGHSAGGHLMALVAVNTRELETRGVPAGAIRGCAPVSAALDMRVEHDGQIAHNHPHQVLFADREDAEEASPIAHISARTPPFLITIGESDFPHLREQGFAMHGALVDAGIATRILDLPGHGHFCTSERSADAGHPWITAVAEMLEKG